MRQAELHKQRLAELRRRIDVERVADVLKDLLPQALGLGGKLLAVRADRRAVDEEAALLHLAEHERERKLDRLEQLVLAVFVDGPLQRRADAGQRRRGSRGLVLVHRCRHAVFRREPPHGVIGAGWVQQVRRELRGPSPRFQAVCRAAAPRGAAA